jgi:hypothetical protein
MAAKKIPAIVETNFIAETPVGIQDISDYQKKVRGLVASCSREKDRIGSENGVRLGDSILMESKAIEVFNAALDQLIEYYGLMVE